MVKLNFFITCFVYKLKLSNTIAILIVNVGNYMAGKTSFPFSPEKNDCAPFNGEHCRQIPNVSRHIWRNVKILCK